MCDELFYVDRYYSDHLKNIHNINKNDYKGCFGLGVTRKVTQNCQLCKGNTKEFLMDQVGTIYIKPITFPRRIWVFTYGSHTNSPSMGICKR